jgi:hypothetical protein
MKCDAEMLAFERRSLQHGLAASALSVQPKKGLAAIGGLVHDLRFGNVVPPNQGLQRIIRWSVAEQDFERSGFWFHDRGSEARRRECQKRGDGNPAGRMDDSGLAGSMISRRQDLEV